MPLLELLTHPIVFHHPRWLHTTSAWLEHIPFAMVLVDLLRPDVFVELGTQQGDSYCAVCEAVEILGLGSRCYAVDSWTGDPHAGAYGGEILEALRRHHDPLYGRFSRLISSTFDDAVSHFSDGSVDLLHIDGYHTYEAVRHDFETWRPKLSERGVVLFHDINVRERDYGAWRVWEELKRSYPSFEFAHAHGLGVLGVGSRLPAAVRALFETSSAESVIVQGWFFRFGHRLRLMADLESTEHRLSEERDERERSVEWLKGQLEQAQAGIVDRDRTIEWLKDEVEQAKAGPAAQAPESELPVAPGTEPPTARARRRWSPARSLRETWYRLAFDAIRLRGLSPISISTGPHEADQAVQWTAPVSIGPTTCVALLAHAPAQVTYRLTMPPRATFRSLIALNPGIWGKNADGVVFSVSVATRDGRRLVQRRWRVDPTNVAGHRRWMACRLGLSRFSGQEVELTLTTTAPLGSSVDFAHSLWGAPTIFARRSVGEVARAYGALLAFPGAWTDGTTRRRLTGPVPLAAARPVESSMRAFLEGVSRDRLKLFLADATSALIFPAFANPLVSVVIPTFNKAEYLYQCLESLLANTDVPFEVIVVDDASQDATSELLERAKNVTWVRNDENLEFVRSCNRGIGLATGRYLLFLNNDVTVTPGWLSTLVETIERDPRHGAVYGKLVRPDGTLQEAGSIVWRDGSALGYGRDDDPDRPEYSYLREVDYGSAACLLVRADLVRQLGGFDERYAPAYYEDADLCFGIRRLGHRVVFQPDVTVFHCEFSSRSRARAEALCAANRPRFADKWASELRGQLPYGAVLRARDRRSGKRVLVMDDQVPAPHLGSGFPRAHVMLRLLAEAGFVITFVPLTVHTQHPQTTHELQQLGIEVLHGDVPVEDVMESRAGHYDVVVVSRPHNGATVLPVVRRHFPRARIVYDAEALFCLRDFLKAEIDGRPLGDTEKRKRLRDEIEIMRHADVVMTVSAAERDIVLREKAHDNVIVWGHPHDVRDPVTPFRDRRDILFVGGFGDGDGPNTDAVVHFAKTLFPRIRERLPDARFMIVGSQPPVVVRDLASPAVGVAGYVEDLTEHYETCRVFVVPTRFAAGISLKLIEAMSAGIPAVVSVVAAAGLDLQDDREALIAPDDDAFVDKVVQAYEDEPVWTALQRGAAEYVRRRCAPDVMRAALVDALGGA
jgi:GT2 family glycosyltransferase/glycosyltransferase involved in cell wall biosynthesis